MVVIDPGEKAEVVRRFANRYRWAFDVLLDPDHDVSRRYGVNSHPRTYLIDREGNLLGLAIGYRDWDSETAFELVEKVIAAGGWTNGETASE